MNKTAKDIAKHTTKAKANYRKWKTTGSKRAQKAADYNYAYVDAVKLQIKHPAQQVSVKKTEVKGSFNSSKTSNYGINNPKTTIRHKSTKTIYK